jgi:hypothetical protein
MPLTLPEFKLVAEGRDTGVVLKDAYLRVIDFRTTQENLVKSVRWVIGVYASESAYDAGAAPLGRLEYVPQGADADLEKMHPEMYFPIVGMLEQISLATKDVVTDPGDPANDILPTLASRIEGAVSAP